jgi:uncharacterized protein YodC (DUF2158 family)
VNDQLKPGDVVQLKSGGPKMTIDSIGYGTGGDKAKCIWFDNNDRKDALFKLDSLVKPEEELDLEELRAAVRANQEPPTN